MFRELQPDMAARLVPLGSVPLQCCPGEAAEELYSQPQFSDMSLTQPRTSPAAEASAAALPGKAGLAAARSYAASLKAASAALACMLSSAIRADT